MSKCDGIYSVEGATKIDAATAKALSERGVVIVEVRDAGSYSRGHLPGAAHLDLNIDLTEESLSRLVGKDDEVVFHCWGESGPYSAYASAKALTCGFTRVSIISPADSRPGRTRATPSNCPKTQTVSCPPL